MHIPWRRGRASPQRLFRGVIGRIVMHCGSTHTLACIRRAPVAREQVSDGARYANKTALGTSNAARQSALVHREVILELICEKQAACATATPRAHGMSNQTFRLIARVLFAFDAPHSQKGHSLIILSRNPLWAKFSQHRAARDYPSSWQCFARERKLSDTKTIISLERLSLPLRLHTFVESLE